MAGHCRVTRVDLSSGQVNEEVIPEGYLKFIGGRGIGAYLLLRDLKARTDPLSPANELIMMPGAAVGNGITGANRITFVTKSLHDTCSFSHAGGTIATALRRNGVECLVITGRAAAPVYLLIADGKISIREAAHIWGKTTGETDAALRNELGSDVIVGCIGPGGENLIPFASFVMEEIHVSAKGGAGCVAGSKNLKAIAVRKRGAIPKSSRREAISKSISKNLQSSPSTKLWKEFGTLNLVVTNYNRGNLAAFNYIHNNSKEGLEAYKPEVFLPLKEGRHSCYRCPVGCSQVYRLQSEAHKGLKSKIEWGTLDALGPLLGIFSYESMCEMQGLCNQYGVDAKEIGSVLGMSIECYEKGIIGPQHTAGIELKWGDFETLRHNRPPRGIWRNPLQGGHRSSERDRRRRSEVRYGCEGFQYSRHRRANGAFLGLGTRRFDERAGLPKPLRRHLSRE